MENNFFSLNIIYYHFITPCPLLYVSKFILQGYLIILFSATSKLVSSANLNSKQQGLPSDKLSSVLDAIILSRLLYAVQSWSGFLSDDNDYCVDAFLRNAYRWQLACSCISVLTILLIIWNWNCMFRASAQSHHCLNHIFEPMRKNLELNQTAQNKTSVQLASI